MEKEEGYVLQIREGVRCFWPHDYDPSRGLRETGVTVRPVPRLETFPYLQHLESSFWVHKFFGQKNMTGQLLEIIFLHPNA